MDPPAQRKTHLGMFGATVVECMSGRSFRRDSTVFAIALLCWLMDGLVVLVRVRFDVLLLLLCVPVRVDISFVIVHASDY